MDGGGGVRKGVGAGARVGGRAGIGIKGGRAEAETGRVEKGIEGVVGATVE